VTYLYNYEIIYTCTCMYIKAMKSTCLLSLLQPADEYQFSGIVNCHHMSPIATHHSLIAVATNSSAVKLVDLKSGSSSHALKGHDTSVYVVRWSPYNEFTLATGRYKNCLMIFLTCYSQNCLPSYSLTRINITL